MKITKGKQNRPRRVLIYGENGVGKSTFACSFPRPLVLNLEDGIGDIDVEHTDRMKDLSEFVNAISWLVNNGNDYQTIVIDTADWLEKLIFATVAKENGKNTVEEIGYGKGYQSVAHKWRFLIDGLTHIWNSGRHIVFVAHVKIANFKNPEGDAYNYYSPALDERGSEIVLEWCDEVLFAKSEVFIQTKEEGFGQKRTVAIDGKKRILVTNEAASQVAKNRLGLPDRMPLDFAEFSKYLRAPASNDIAGIVKDGSSKVA